MGLFNLKSSKNSSDEEKIEKFKQKYGLDEIKSDDLDKLSSIYLELIGTEAIKLGTGLTGKSEEVAKMSYLTALVEQNWLIINQLSRLNKNIEKLIEK